MITITQDIKLVEITINDQDKLMDLACKIYPPEYQYLWKNKDCNWYLNRCYGLDNFKEELSDVNSNYYFIKYKSQIEGLIRFVYNKQLDQFPYKSATYVHRIYLSKASQGTGCAQNLINWIEQQSIKKGMDLMWLESMDTKERAIKFYKKNGFKTLIPKQLQFELMLHHFRGMYVMYKNIP